MLFFLCTPEGGHQLLLRPSLLRASPALPPSHPPIHAYTHLPTPINLLIRYAYITTNVQNINQAERHKIPPPLKKRKHTKMQNKQKTEPIHPSIDPLILLLSSYHITTTNTWIVFHHKSYHMFLYHKLRIMTNHSHYYHIDISNHIGRIL